MSRVLQCVSVSIRTKREAHLQKMRGRCLTRLPSNQLEPGNDTFCTELNYCTKFLFSISAALCQCFDKRTKDDSVERKVPDKVKPVIARWVLKHTDYKHCPVE